LQEQVIWLTGCASGVGLHLADQFLNRGARVFATDVNLDGMRHAARARGWDSERLLMRRLDVREPAAWDELYTELIGAWARLDMLFNVAGVIHPGRLAEAADRDIDLHMDVNFKGLALGCRVAARHMTAQGRGHIVNLASLAGIAAVPGIGLYSASKHAVRAYSLVLAQELRDHGVAVTVLCPDAIETPMLELQEGFEEAALTFSGGSTLTVEDISRVVFERILPKRPIEVAIPRRRYLQARIVSSFPRLSGLMLGRLRRRGRKAQLARRDGPRQA
jgi:3-oxoacyl-[acyl-carrier protein] reductase